MEQSLVHEFMAEHAMAFKEIDGLLVNKLLLVSMMYAWEVFARTAARIHIRAG